MRNTADAAEALVAAASLGGDVDSICSMVGSLVGARHGMTGLPAEWIDALSRESPTPTQLAALADVVFEQAETRFIGPEA